MRSSTRFTLAAALVVAILSGHSPAFAQKPQPRGGITAAYSIIDLRSPFHAADGNWSRTVADRISRIDPATGLVYIIGDYEQSSSALRSCLWAISAAGSVAVIDLDGVIEARRQRLNDPAARHACAGAVQAFRNELGAHTLKAIDLDSALKLDALIGIECRDDGPFKVSAS